MHSVVAIAARIAGVGNMFEAVKVWFRRRQYRDGETVSNFIARDVRRDIQVLSTARIDEGIIIAQSRIAARKAMDAAETAGLSEPLTRGSVVASDAFFPFADGLLSAVEAGATAVIQPGGSMRDDEVIEAANDAGIAMVFTGTRHFRH